MSFAKLYDRVKDKWMSGMWSFTILVDVSGSMPADLLQDVRHFIEDLTNLAGTRVNLVFFDHKVESIWCDIDSEDVKPIFESTCSRGGTNLSEVFTHIEKAGVISDLQIVISDGCIAGIPDERPYPVLWAWTSGVPNIPFPKWGEGFRIDG